MFGQPEKVTIPLAPTTRKTVITPLFNTMTLLKKFTRTHDEFPPIDNDNWYDPDYTSFHKKNAPGRITRFVQAMGLKNPLWDVHLFKKIMVQVTESRELSGLIGRFIQKITTKDDDQFIFFGTLNAAFHSLVRCLEELMSQGLIDESLMFLKPNVYIVFNGNVVNGSPYILETLTLILVLMQKNPTQIFYTRGQLEDKEYWKEEGLRRELENKASRVSKETIPMARSVQEFFNTLPLALYLMCETPEKTKNIIRVSAWATDFKELDEDSFVQFFNDSQEGVSTLKLGDKRPERSAVPLKVLIRNSRLGLGYNPTTGLRQSSKEKGIFVWTILSGPTGVKRRLFDFFYDAFTVLTIRNSTNTSTIRLCNRDIRDISQFSCGPTFNVFTGVEEQMPKKTSETCPCPEEEKLKKQLKDLQEELQRLKKEPPCPPAKVSIIGHDAPRGAS